jgi:hypothetical protein
MCTGRNGSLLTSVSHWFAIGADQRLDHLNLRVYHHYFLFVRIYRVFQRFSGVVHDVLGFV